MQNSHQYTNGHCIFLNRLLAILVSLFPSLKGLVQTLHLFLTCALDGKCLTSSLGMGGGCLRGPGMTASQVRVQLTNRLVIETTFFTKFCLNNCFIISKHNLWCQSTHLQWFYITTINKFTKRNKIKNLAHLGLPIRLHHHLAMRSPKVSNRNPSPSQIACRLHRRS